jgi:hypothetical protein
LLLLLLWPSVEDKEVTKQEAARSKQSRDDGGATPDATAARPRQSAADAGEESGDNPVLRRALEEVVAESKETGEAIPPGDAIADLLIALIVSPKTSVGSRPAPWRQSARTPKPRCRSSRSYSNMITRICARKRLVPRGESRNTKSLPSPC